MSLIKSKKRVVDHGEVFTRAILYEDVGQRGRASSEFEQIYAADPMFEDGRLRSGL